MYGVVITTSRRVGEGIRTTCRSSSFGIQIVNARTFVWPGTTVMPYSKNPYFRAGLLAVSP
jgi:hypothetical protein